MVFNVLISIVLILMFFILFMLNSKVEVLEECIKVLSNKDSFRDEDDYYNEYLQMKEEREREFDDRISRIKDELSNSYPQQNRGHIAEILDPNIQNLPHDVIHSVLPDVEIAE